MKVSTRFASSSTSFHWVFLFFFSLDMQIKQDVSQCYAKTKRGNDIHRALYRMYHTRTFHFKQVNFLERNQDATLHCVLYTLAVSIPAPRDRTCISCEISRPHERRKSSVSHFHYTRFALATDFAIFPRKLRFQ